jgi:hypothetical protein
VPLRLTILLLTPLLFSPLTAEIEEDIPFGIETVTGLRSSYVYRGVQLAEETLEAQIETKIALGKDYSVPLAAWTLAETSGNFSNTAISVGLQRDWQDFQLTGFLDYQSFENSLFEDGFDLGLQGKWFPGEYWDFGLEARYNFGAEGRYYAFESGYSHPFGDDFYLTAVGGLSAVSNYYGSSGFNDFYGRLSATYNVNSFLSLTPFVGFSLADDLGEEAFVGLWLAVSF